MSSCILIQRVQIGPLFHRHGYGDNSPSPLSCSQTNRGGKILPCNIYSTETKTSISTIKILPKSQTGIFTTAFYKCENAVKTTVHRKRNKPEDLPNLAFVFSRLDLCFCSSPSTRPAIAPQQAQPFL